MKKTHFIELINNIKKTKVSFISIFVFVTLGIAIFLSFSWMSNALIQSTNQFIHKYNMHDLELFFPYGASDEDIDEIRSFSEVKDVEGRRTIYDLFILNDEIYQAKITELTEIVDRLYVVEGSLPKFCGEIAVDAAFAHEKGLIINDRITFSDDSNVEDEYLKTDSFVITALIVSPEYASNPTIYGNAPVNGIKIDCGMLVSKESIREDSLTGYNDFVITCNGVNELDYSSEEYKQRLEELKISIVEKVASIGEKRKDYILNQLEDAYVEIEDKEKELDEKALQLVESKKRIAEGKQELLDGENQIREGKIALETAEKELFNSKSKLEEGRQKISQAEEEYNQNYNKWLDGLNELEEGKRELEKSQAEYDYNKCQLDGAKRDLAIIRSIDPWQLDECVNQIDQIKRIVERYKGSYSGSINSLEDLINVPNEFEKKLNESEHELNEALDKLHAGQEKINNYVLQLTNAKQELDDGLASINAKKAELEDGQAKYDAAVSDFHEKEKEYEDNLRLLEDKRAEIEKASIQAEEGERELTKAEDKLKEAKKKLQNSTDVGSQYKDVNSYNVLTRYASIYLNTVEVMLNIINTIRFSMASLFIIVGVLVCYSSITRIVYSQQSQIGTKKALGMTNQEISFYYLMYTGMSTLIGCIMGVALGCALEAIVVKAMLKSFMFDESVFYIDFGLTAIVCILQLLLMLAVTYISTRKILSKTAIDLLNGNDELAKGNKSYENFIIYRKLNIFKKVIVSNCIHEKRRVIGTLIGIMGCTALIVTSLTFKNNVQNSFKKQFEDYTHYNYIVYFDTSLESAETDVEEVIRTYTENVAKCYYSVMFEQQPGGDESVMRVMVPENVDDFKKVYSPVSVENVSGSNPYEGVWVHYAYRNYFKDQALPDIKLETMLGKDISIPITGFYDDYLTFGSMTISKDKYEDIFGKKPEYNVFLVSLPQESMVSLNDKLNNTKGFLKMDDYYNFSKKTFNIFESMSVAIVAVYLTMAVVMSLLVLLNLLSQFVDEKKKEIIVLLINGYDYRTVKKYIYIDTVILTIIGTILGMVMGSILGYLTVRGFDSPVVYFIKNVELQSCLLGFVGTSLLAFIMCLIALRKIDKFELTDVGK